MLTDAGDRVALLVLRAGREGADAYLREQLRVALDQLEADRRDAALVADAARDVLDHH
jgi:hypothetical protein